MWLSKPPGADDAPQTESFVSSVLVRSDRSRADAEDVWRASGKVIAILNTYRQEMRGIVGNWILCKAPRYR